MTNKKIKINRAPVLTLWAAVVAERLGYDKNEALTFGKAVAGPNAQSKGRLYFFNSTTCNPPWASTSYLVIAGNHIFKNMVVLLK